MMALGKSVPGIHHGVNHLGSGTQSFMQALGTVFHQFGLAGATHKETFSFSGWKVFASACALWITAWENFPWFP